MAEYTGTAMYMTFAGTTIHADYREFSASEEIDLVDASAGADVAKTYLTALEDGTASLTLLDQTGGTAATAMWQLMDKGTSGTLIWAPEGTATGKPKHTVVAIVSSRERKVPYDDVVELTFEFQFSGVVADAVY
ncbi:MAG: hypothetical protein IT323_22710 [Anaerolineae bacterium]|nr:hypothetical protein [Anaerolineae bacterium]